MKPDDLNGRNIIVYFFVKSYQAPLRVFQMSNVSSTTIIQIGPV